MSGWRHAEESLLVRWCMAPGAAAGWCTCQNPQPDPASPCGLTIVRSRTQPVICKRPGDSEIHRMWPVEPYHLHQPSLCATCHHAIEAAP